MFCVPTGGTVGNGRTYAIIPDNVEYLGTKNSGLGRHSTPEDWELRSGGLLSQHWVDRPACVHGGER